MLLPLSLIPELRRLPAAERQKLWRLALRDRFRGAADLARLLLLLAGVVGVVALPLKILPASGVWRIAGIALIIVSYSVFLDLILIQRYRPVVRRLCSAGGDGAA